jgi:hypothetical protein
VLAITVLLAAALLAGRSLFRAATRGDEDAPGAQR